MTPLDVLAVARLARAWVVDAEKFPLLAPAKAALTERAEGTPWEPLLSCRWCVSIYAGIAAVAASRLAPKVWRPASFVLAASQAAGMLGVWEDTQDANAEAARAQSAASLYGARGG